jgi:hypothetical protein
MAWKNERKHLKVKMESRPYFCSRPNQVSHHLYIILIVKSINYKKNDSREKFFLTKYNFYNIYKFDKFYKRRKNGNSNRIPGKQIL